MADYGTDLLLDGRDIVFTPDGDIELCSDARLVAQDVAEELSIAMGSVEWDRKAGSNLLHQLNSAEDADSFVLNELERVALKDARVDASSVSSEKLVDGRFRLSFSVRGTVKPVELYFDLESILGGGNG